MSSLDSTRCASCHSVALQLARLRITLAYDGQSFTVPDDALVCDTCGDKLIGERASDTRRTEIVYAAHCGGSARFHIAVTTQRLIPLLTPVLGANDCTVAVVHQVRAH